MLNQAGSVSRRDGGLAELERQLYDIGDVEMIFKRWLREMAMSGVEEMGRRGVENYTLGYVTQDVSFTRSS